MSGFFEQVLFFYLIFQAALFSYWVFLLICHRKRRASAREKPGITVIIPAYNEEKNIAGAIRSVLSTGYPNLRILIVDDGSTDRTAEIARSMGADVLVLDHMGKAPAVNEALKHVDTEIFVVLDADTRISSDALDMVVSAFSDPHVAAVSGKMLARGSGLLGVYQDLEYVYASEVFAAHTDNGKPLPFFFGAFTAYKTDIVRSIGGFPLDTPGEDLDLFVTLLRKGYSFRYVPAVAWTKVPTRLPDLLEQRLRWNTASLLTFWKHRDIAYRYPVYLYLFWPLYGLLAFPGILSQFLRYISWHFSNGGVFGLIHYLFTWFTFYGPIYSLIHLAEWQFPPLAVVGSVVGILAMIVLGIGLARNFSLRRLVAFVFFPMYGTFFMGFVLFLLPFYVLTRKTRHFMR